MKNLFTNSRTRWLGMVICTCMLLLWNAHAWGTYYYRGNQNDWGADAMTASADGYYEYFEAKGYSNNGNKNNNFKVSTSTSSWEYNNGYYTKGYNSTDITNAGNWDKDNICVYNSTDFYILVYKPSTAINATSNPVVCFSSYLPSGAPRFLVGENWTSASWSNTDAANQMTYNTSSSSYSKEVSISDATKEIALKITARGDWSTTVYDKDDKGTGYNLSQALGGSDNLTFKVSHAGTTKITLTSTGKINVYAPYQVSYAAGTGATGTVSASAVTTYGSTCTLSSSTFSKTGYTQDGWSTSDGGGKSYNLGGTYTGGYEDVTLYPHWKADTYNGTIDKNGGAADKSYTATYDATTLTISSVPTRTGYHISGYYEEAACTHMVANSSKALQASTSYTSSASKWNYTSSAPKLYAGWEGNTYYVSYNANGGTGTMTNSSHTYGTASNLSACTFTAPDGYTFAGWATSADGSVAYADGASVSTLATSGTYPLYAKWDELSGGSVTLTAGTGGKVSKDNSVWGASATITDITSDQAVNIYAQANTGYTFSTWTKISGSGSVKTNAASGAYNAIGYANDEVTASFTENMSSLSVSRTIDEGSPSIAAPTVTGSYTNVGYATTRTITAAAAATGYALTSWTVTNGARTDGGGATANPITVRSNGNASESVTVAANYTIQSYTISASNSNVTYSPASGTSFKYGATGSKMTITPKSGYKITGITSNNGAITASADNNAAGSWTVTGTMPAANVTLTVTTAALSTIYLQGRFRIRTASGVESYKSLGSATASGWSSEWVTSGTSQISMTYNYETGFYDLVTYRSAAELKNDGNLYFYLCVGGTNTYPTSSNLTVPSSKPGSANAQTSTGNNFYFNDNGDYINVILHYDAANKKLWYTGTAETVYSTTCYAGDHGSINAKGTAISKNASSSVNIGTNSPISATPESGYSFDKWVTTGSVTVTDPYSASTTVTASAASGTVTATYLKNSGWYLHGVIDGYTSWETSAKERPVDRPYRGISGVYYRRITNLDNNAYFGIHDGTNKYSGHESTSSDYNYTTLNTAVQLYVNSSKSFQAKDDFDNNWVVIKTTDTKKFWIQSPATYYTVSVSNEGSGARGTVTLKEKSYGGLETYQFANGETIHVEIDTTAHYSIKSVKLGDTNVTMTHSSGTKFTGDVVMPASDKTLTVTYTPWYQVKLAASPAAAADAPTAAKTTGGATVNHNDYVISGTSVTFTKQSANGGYTWDHWENNGSGSETGNTYVATISATTTVTAVYTENDYTVTVQSSDATYGGTVASSSVDGHKTTKVTLPKATPKPGYFFYNWTTTAGTLTNASSASACQINGLTSTATVTANFRPIWTVAGGDAANTDPDDALGNWDQDVNTLWQTYKYESDSFAYFDITTLLPNMDYQFKITQRSTGEYVWWGGKDADLDINYTNANTRLDLLNNSGKNYQLRTAATGTYTFDINLSDSDHPIVVKFPTSYTVTFGYGTGGSEVTASAASGGGSLTSGYYVAPGSDITFTQSEATGYTFKGWYNAESGGTEISCMSDEDDNVYDNIAGNISVYAQYTANTYAVTFNATTNGGTLSGSSPKNVTFDATSLASCPTANKAGYCFDGWYTAATSGKKLINPDGSFVANVTDWTDEDGKWKVADAATVYAVYVKPEIIMTQGGKGLISSMPGYDTLIVNQSFGCTPAVDYNISYTVGYRVSHTQLAPQPKINYCAAAVAGVRHDTIIMPVKDGANSYEVVAYLKTGTTRGSGTDVTTDTLNVDVETSYAVKVRAVVDGVEIAEERLALLYPSFAAIHVTIWKEINGYQLDHIDLGVGVTQESVREEDTYYWNAYYAANASTITAVYKPKANTVYLFNADTHNYCMYAASRTKLYDYGTGGYWHTSGETQKGAGSYGMTGDTVIATDFDSPVWMASIGGSTTSFAFTSDKLNGVEEFYSYTASNSSKLPAHVIYRTDYNATLPMFVPVAKDKDDCYIINKNGDDGWAQYYRGFWVKRSPDLDSTGYYLKVYDKVSGDPAPKLIQSVPLRLTQTGEDGTWELTATIDLEANKTYGFKFTKATGANSVVWYADTNEGTMTSAAHTGWDNFVTSDKKNTGLTTTAAGDYTFHIYCVDYGTKAANAASATEVQGKFAVTVDYAAESGDYRVIYSDATQTEVISSPSIRPRANGQDTVSFFIRKNSESRVMKIQKFTTSPSAAWNDVSTVDLSGIAKDSVYVIYLEQDEDMTTIEEKGIDFYDGDYYIRTDCVDEHKWDYKKSLDNHRMIPTDYGMTAKQPDPFSHYYVHWLTGNSNVKFIVANKYAPCLSDTVITDDWVTDTGGNLGEKGANIRFMYNKGTNKAMRAYLYGSQENDDDYLKLTKTSGSMTDRTRAITEITFTDLGNFTYQAEIAAQPGLRGKLTAKYLSTTQYFLGSEDSDEELIGGSTGEFQNILLTYDFKSNRLICAWQPSGATITEDLDINADILIIRKAQGDAQQIRFSGKTKIDDVHYIYGVIEFEYRDMYHMLYTWDWWSYSHCMYYISFPFDVLVNDIAGVGTLGVDWRIQRYNGAKRAEKGWFEDGEKTFWEDIHAGDTLHAYEGYSLLLNRSRFNGTAGNIWENKTYGDKVYLYFPSVSPLVGELSNQSVTVHVPAHQCTKDQTFTNSYGMLVNHKVTDSHWNMIGTPMFADTTASSIATGPVVETGYGSETLQYVYAWSYYGNTLGIKLTLDEDWRFKTMYSYMAQYAGDIVFQGPAINKVVAAKRNEEKKNYHVKLEISKDDMFIGRTYIELRENAVDSFLLNEDICMFRNGVNADLFTYAGGYEAGANVLPIANQVVPVGIAVKQAGTYVFSMPANFDGEVILVDKYAQTRTNLMLEDYEVALPTGEITDRFEVEININKVATAIDGTNGDGSLKDGNAHKFIENGMMYILQNGALYDAQGKRVK